MITTTTHISLSTGSPYALTTENGSGRTVLTIIRRSEQGAPYTWQKAFESRAQAHAWAAAQ